MAWSDFISYGTMIGATLIPFGALTFSLIVLEFFISYQRRWSNYDWKECLSSLAVKHIEIMTAAFYAVAFSPLFIWFYNHRLYTVELGPVATPIVYMVLIEFYYYWTHRFSHAFSIGWANHASHHSFTKLNLINGARIGVTTPFALYFFAVIPLFALGFSPQIFAAYLKWHLLYQLLVHTELIGRLGFLDHIFNTPSNHRVHHGTQDIYKNKNFGSITVVFDRLFGTYQPELESEKPVYGLAEGPVSQNPLRICLVGWEALLKNAAIRRAK